MKTKVIAIGASAGGLEPLRTVVAGLPADLPAAVCVVLHVSATAKSALAEILGRSGALASAVAADGERLEPGRIYVAPPDRHLLVGDGRIRLDHGELQNGHRPAVDPLFVTAADDLARDVCAVVLSGTRDDGAAGMAHVKRRGGCAIVQDPDEANYPGMPASAIAAAAVDTVLVAAEIAGALVSWAHDGIPGEHELALEPDHNGAPPPLVHLTCPECHGLLSETSTGGAPGFTCPAGHRLAPERLAAASADLVEQVLKAAVGPLEERSAMLHRMAEHAKAEGHVDAARRFAHEAADVREQSRTLRSTIAAGDESDVAS